MTTSSQSFFDESAEGGVVGARGRVAPAAIGGGGAGGGVGIHPEDARAGHLGRKRPGQRRPDEPETYDGHGREGGVGAVQFSRFSHGSVCFLNRSGTSHHPLYTNEPPPRQTPASAAFSARLSASACLTGFRLGLYTDGAGWLAGANGGYLVFKFVACEVAVFRTYRERLFHFLALTVRSITAIITRTNVSNCVPSNHGNLLI